MNSFLQSIAYPYQLIVGKLGAKNKTQEISKSESTPQRANVFHSILSPLETYVVSFQSLLIWERPVLSAAAFFTISIAYWLIVYWNRRFFSIVSIFLLMIFSFRTWINYIWPKIEAPPPEGEDTESWVAVNPDVLSVPEVSRYLNDFSEKMIILWKDIWKLRKENHGLFCALMCGFLSVIAVIGKLIPGILILYFLVLSVSLGPGIALYLLPSSICDQIVGFFAVSDSSDSDQSKVSKSSDRDNELDEFIPETTAEVLRQLSLQEELPEAPSPGMVLSESGTEDLASINEGDELSLCQGLGGFPSIEEEDGESEMDDEVISGSDIMPSLEPEANGMHFVPTHFKDSSESESEAAFTEGLSFDQKLEREAAMAGDVIQASSQHISKKTVPRKESSSSEIDDCLADFEILEESDVYKTE